MSFDGGGMNSNNINNIKISIKNEGSNNNFGYSPRKPGKIKKNEEKHEISSSEIDEEYGQIIQSTSLLKIITDFLKSLAKGIRGLFKSKEN